MLTIVNVNKNSRAKKLHIESGDQISRINQHIIRDKLDFYYYMADEAIDLEIIKNDGRSILFHLEKDDHDLLGIEVADLKMKTCGSKCLFCFVDQNPEGMRETLYFRDGDYRFSFMHGHFVTLDNVGPAALKRIVEQHMSPINISVHVTDPHLRVQLTGHPHAGRILEKIKTLAEGNITMHTQIVLCKDINDGDYLLKSISDLGQYFPQVNSISVVPVGITRYQKHDEFRKIRIDRTYALNLLDTLEKQRSHFYQKFGSHFVHPSDEWYLLAQQDFPETDVYDDFPQYENGVGMCRVLIDDMQAIRSRLPKTLKKFRQVTMITGKLAGPVLKKYVLPVLNQIENLRVDMLPVENKFYGELVTVCGLLTGQDIRQGLADHPELMNDFILLPHFCLNDGGLFLDDLTMKDLEQILPGHTIIEQAMLETEDWMQQVLGCKLKRKR